MFLTWKDVYNKCKMYTQNYFIFASLNLYTRVYTVNTLKNHGYINIISTWVVELQVTFSYSECGIRVL